MTNHVPELSLCKQLKEAGYPQVGLFKWYGKYPDEKFILQYDLSQEYYAEYIVAPLASELIEKLPFEFSIVIDKDLSAEPPSFIIELWKENHTPQLSVFVDDGLSNALAKMYIYLQKEKLL